MLHQRHTTRGIQVVGTSGTSTRRVGMIPFRSDNGSSGAFRWWAMMMKGGQGQGRATGLWWWWWTQRGGGATGTSTTIFLILTRIWMIIIIIIIIIAVVATGSATPLQSNILSQCR